MVFLRKNMHEVMLVRQETGLQWQALSAQLRGLGPPKGMAPGPTTPPSFSPKKINFLLLDVPPFGVLVGFSPS